MLASRSRGFILHGARRAVHGDRAAHGNGLPGMVLSEFGRHRVLPDALVAELRCARSRNFRALRELTLVYDLRASKNASAQAALARLAADADPEISTAARDALK